MDAISFVLGIKSSHLRSSHLRDLVYRGRVLKTSVIHEDGSATANGVNGHGNGEADVGPTQTASQERSDPKSAWVMAVYEDDAGDEQLWKRTITNSGASEYRINSQIVTAQQYNEALEAENILIKARNFLVFQGDVEAIASQSPRDLTRLIEQISGSLEYKAEYEKLKEAQEAAMENQNYNLNRRRGINSEIKQYQEQKREAENYARKVDQRDQAIVTHILWKLYRFQSLIEESGETIKRHQEELKEHRRGIARYENDLEDAKKDQARVGREVGKIERNIKAKEVVVEEKERGLLPLTEKILVIRENQSKVSPRIAVLSKEQESRSDTVKRLSKDLKTVEKAESQWEIEWKNRGQHEGRALGDADLSEYNKLKEEVNRRTSADQMKADNLLRQQRADEETVNSLRSKVAMMESRIGDYETEISGIRDNKSTASQQADQIQKEIETKKKAYSSLTSEKLRVRQLRTELEEKFQEVGNRLMEAEDGRKQSDKEVRMRATIADLKRLFPGVKGRVHELCKPKQKRYEEAVSTVLGRHIDAIVVDDEKTAKDCIQLLREQHRGLATFIPLDTIQGTPTDSNLKGIHKGTRMAIDTIDYDRTVERAMTYACGNAIICDNLSIAKHICYEKGVEAKAVTLDGTVIHKGGLMTGGRGKEVNARRWDDTDIDNLRKLADRLLNDMRNLPDGRRNAAEEETLQSELSGLEQRLLYLTEESQGLKRNLESKDRELSHAKKELAETNPRYLERKRELDDLRATLKSCRDLIGEVEDEVFARFCERLRYENIRTYEAQQGSLQQEGAQKKLEFKQQKSRLENRIKFERQQLQEVESRIEGLRSKLQRDQSLLEQLTAEKDAVADEADTLASELDLLRDNLEKQQAIHEKKAERVAEQRREVQKRNKNVEGTTREIARLGSEIQRSSADRYALLRRCKVDDITLPLTTDSQSLEQLPLDGILHGDPDAMDTSDDPNEISETTLAVQDYGIEVDFEDLEEDLKEASDFCDHFLPLTNTAISEMIKHSTVSYRRKSQRSKKTSSRWLRTCEPSSGSKVWRAASRPLRRSSRMRGEGPRKLKTTFKKSKNSGSNSLARHFLISRIRSDQYIESLQRVPRFQWEVKRKHFPPLP